MRTQLGALLVATTLSAPTVAQVVRLALDAPAETDASVSIDTTGSVAYSVSTGNPFGTNPGFRRQIFRWNTATASGIQVTSYDDGVESVSVSGDGTWLAFVSNADPLGTNHDESPELYVMLSDGTGLTQLTNFNLLPQRGLRRAVISGSANRIAFLGAIDPFGTNPTLVDGVFVIDRNGSNLKQLAIDVGSIVDISDDGSKVIYEKADQLAGINASGTGNHTFTSTAELSDASISGNGLKVVYALGSRFPFGLKARSFDGNPATIVNLGTGDRPTIIDDATIVYHRRDATPQGIYRINSTGGTATLVSAGRLEMRRVSGDGTRLLVQDTGLFALDSAGGNLQQLTQPTFTPIQLPHFDALSDDGNRVWYLADIPGGTFDPELFAYDFDTGTTTQLTDAAMPPFENNGYFSVSDAGDVVFVKEFWCGLVKISASGAITPFFGCEFASERPVIRGDGGLIVFYGLPPDGPPGVYRINSDGSGLALITTTAGGPVESAISEGTPNAWVAYTDAFPNFSLYRVKTDGSGKQAITPDTYVCYSPTISADGDRIAFLSEGNYAGQNADHSFEVFLYETTTQTFTQLTHDQSLGANVRITRDGRWVYTSNLKISADTGASEPASGFLHSTSSVGTFVPNATGSSWLFTANDVIDHSPSGLSLYRAELGVAPKIQVGKASPTVVTWDPSPDALRYDVVRGSVASLAILGSTVDLGPAVCLEDDSPDNHTRGFEDAAIPAPGEAFFFLYRGSVGVNAATGSYGQGTGAKERVAGAGGCNP